MDKVLTVDTTTVTHFKANPNQVVTEAEGRPFAVLSNNRPTFYVVPPELYAQWQEILADVAMLDTVKRRLAEPERFVPVDIADL